MAQHGILAGPTVMRMTMRMKMVVVVFLVVLRDTAAWSPEARCIIFYLYTP